MLGARFLVPKELGQQDIHPYAMSLTTICGAPHFGDAQHSIALLLPLACVVCIPPSPVPSYAYHSLVIPHRVFVFLLFVLSAATVNMQDFCISNFLPSEVVPCIRENRDSIYELDENGNAYGNIYELRKVCTCCSTIHRDNVGINPILLVSCRCAQ